MTEPTDEQCSAIARALLEVLAHSQTAVAILREVPDGLEWIQVNDAFAQLSGYSLDELRERNVFDVVGAEQRDRMLHLSAAIRGGRPIPPALEVLMVHATGATIPVELTFSRRDAPGGAIVVAMVHDARMQQSLSLLEADRVGLVGALAAGFAHEINNPLTTVLLNLRALRRQLADAPEQLHTVDDITTGAERIANNVRAFQTLASRGSRRPIDLASVVTAALRLAAPTIAPLAHVVRQIFPVGPVVGEESRIGQAVLAMMLFSASGFDREGLETSNNRVTVLVEERGNDVVVEVSDNGRALGDEDIVRAFDPFFRSHVRGAGVGVGLGVARSVAAALGGDVTLVSRPGGGAVITMRLPVHA